MPSPLPSSTSTSPNGVADEQVEIAVVVEVGDGQAGRVGAGVVGGRREKSPLAVAEVDAHLVGASRAMSETPS